MTPYLADNSSARCSSGQLALLAGVSLSAAAFLAVGYILASLVPSVRVLTHIVTLLRGLWFGETLGEHLREVAVLGAYSSSEQRSRRGRFGGSKKQR